MRKWTIIYAGKLNWAFLDMKGCLGKKGPLIDIATTCFSLAWFRARDVFHPGPGHGFGY
jgi:hypothetical protein